MKSTIKLLTSLKDAGIKLWVQEGKLKYRAPEGAMGAERIAMLKEHKQAIIAFLAKAGQQVQSTLEKADRNHPLPLSTAQRRIWITERLNGPSAVHNIIGALRMKGPLDIDVLQQSMDALIERHEALRATFRHDHGTPVQVIQAPYSLPLPVEDLREVPIDDREARAVMRVQEEVHTAFDLEKGPLVRARLLQMADDEHIMPIAFHHIVFDAWSQRVFTKELVHIYEGLLLGKQAALPEKQWDYADYLHWQAQPGQQQRSEEDINFWRQHLKAAPGLTRLPTDYPRPAVQRFEGATVHHKIDAVITDKLRALAKEEDMTMFMTLSLALFVLLHRYTGQDDLVIGTPVAGRERQEWETIVGYFVNMLPLRMQLDGNPTIRAALKHFKNSSLPALAHQDTPFDQIIENLEIDKGKGYNPLFQVAFTFQNSLLIDFELPDMQVTSLEVESQAAKFDLNLWLEESPEGLIGRMDYNKALFKEKTIRSLLACFDKVLTVMVNQPEQTVGHMGLLTDGQKENLLQIGSNHRAYPAIAVHQLFEEQVQNQPEALALLCQDKTLTYQALNQEANKLAHHLITGEGVNKGDRVALLLGRSSHMIIGILAVLKAGGIYVPLDPAHPEGRIRHIIEAVEPVAILTQSDYMFDLGYYGGKIYVADLQQATLTEEVSNPAIAIENEEACYIMYTSGSTGTPKGVVATHKGVARLVKETDYIQITHEDRLLGLSSYAFDGATFDIFGALLNGAALVLATREEALELPALMAKINQQKVSVMFVTTALFNAMVENHLDSLAGVRKILFGGERVSIKSVGRYLSKHGAEKLIHVYGPTENTTFSTWYPINEIDPKGDNVPIGKPIGNASAYVVDKQGQLQLPGVVGELWVGGEGLAQGYWQDAAQTERKFIDHPWEAGKKLYRTGDLVRALPTDDVEFIGRVDDQVKIRGFRIEPGEITGQLLTHPEVQHGLVLTHLQNGYKVLVGYYGSKEGLDSKSLQTYLQKRLPSYMVPTALIGMPELPLTPNGKVDKRVLPSPDEVLGHEEKEQEVPQGAVEEQIARCFGQELNKENLSRHANFFTLGGDSIRAIRLVSALNALFEKNIEVKDIFGNPTVAGLAAFVSATSNPDTQLLPLEKVIAEIDDWKNEALQNDDFKQWVEGTEIEDFYPMSAIQTGMLYYSFLNKGTSVYHDQILHELELEGLTSKHFDRCFALLVGKHQILRTSFHLDAASEPIQAVHKMGNEPLPITHYDLSGTDESEQKQQISRWMEEDRQNGFEEQLRQQYQWRAVLFKLSAHKFVVLRSFHHALLDGWSDASFMTELIVLLHTKPATLPTSLSMLQCSYKDYIIDQWRHKHAEAIGAFWKKYLHAYQRTALPLNRVYIPGKHQKKKARHIVLDEAEKNGIRAFASENGLSLRHVGLGILLRLLQVTTDSADITLGTMSHGRPQQTDGDQLLGCFLNSAPFRQQVNATQSHASLLAEVKENADQLRAYDRYPLTNIVAQLGEDAAVQNPIFDILYIYLDFHVYGDLSAKGLSPRAMVENFTLSNTPFDFCLYKEGEAMALSIASLEGLYTDAELVQFEGYLKRIIRQIMMEANQPLQQSEVIGKEEMDLICQASLSPLKLPMVSDQELLTTAFEHKAAEIPDSTALIFEGEHYTYRVLNQKANQVASYLRQQIDIAPDTLVALLMHRSAEQLIAQLGILKAGAAYLPLDTGNPTRRHQAILEEAVVASVITDEPDHRASMAQWNPIVWDTGIFDTCPTDNIVTSTKAHHLAYVIYTSGSTGKPKGVMIEHRSALNTINDHAHRAGINHEDKVLHYMPATFDPSVAIAFMALRSGACLVMPSTESRTDTAAIERLVQENEVTVTPLPAGVLGAFALAKTPSLRAVFSGGEAPNAKVVQKLAGRKYFNAYGPTECSICAVIYSTDTPEKLPDPVPIGQPVSNMAAHLLNQWSQPVPFGAEGEICLAGPGLARGYLNRPRLTKERFAVLPETGERLYHTGDRGRFLPDGSILFLGRNDQQVKVNGFRIEVGEVENALLQHPEVANAAVLTHQNSTASTVLVAFYEPIAGAQLEESSLRTYLATLLPPYMLPAAMLAKAQLPLNENSKVDRKALQIAASGALMSNKPYEAPGTDTEKQLAGLWQQLLGCEQIGLHDDFFEIGGNSITAMQLVAHIKEEKQVNLALKSFYEGATLYKLARYIDGLLVLSAAVSADTLGEEEVERFEF